MTYTSIQVFDFFIDFFTPVHLRHPLSWLLLRLGIHIIHLSVHSLLHHMTSLGFWSHPSPTAYCHSILPGLMIPWSITEIAALQTPSSPSSKKAATSIKTHWKLLTSYHRYELVNSQLMSTVPNLSPIIIHLPYFTLAILVNSGTHQTLSYHCA